MGASAACGIRSNERRPIMTRKPMMNQGSRRDRPGFAAPGARSRKISDRASMTGPSISTRTSLTTVPV